MIDYKYTLNNRCFKDHLLELEVTDRESNLSS